MFLRFDPGTFPQQLNPTQQTASVVSRFSSLSGVP